MKRSGLKVDLFAGRFVEGKITIRSNQPSNDGVKVRRGSLRVWIFLFVVMDLVAVENECRVLRYVHPIVHKVLGREVRRREPEGRVRSFDLM